MNLDALQNWAFETGLMVSLLICVILLIRRPFARWFGANAAYALWSLPLIRLCLPVMSVPESWVPPIFRPAPPLQSEPRPEAAIELPAAIEDMSGAFAEPAAVSSEGVSIVMIGLMVWAALAVIWLGFQLIQQRQFKARLAVESDAPDENLTPEIRSAAQRVGLRASPNVRISHGNIGPLITGVINPLVILPKAFSSDFEADERNFALIHEFAHLKRKDLWVAFVALVFRAVNWPNPLVHFAAHRLRADQEAACDAFVVKLTGGHTTHSYAETLVKAARHAGSGGTKVGQLALSLTDAEAQNVEDDVSKGD